MQEAFYNHLSSLTPIFQSNFLAAMYDVLATDESRYMSHGMLYQHPMADICKNTQVIYRKDCTIPTIETNGLDQNLSMPASTLLNGTLLRHFPEKQLGQELRLLQSEMQDKVNKKSPPSPPNVIVIRNIAPSDILHWLRITHLDPVAFSIPDNLLSQCDDLTRFADLLATLVLEPPKLSPMQLLTPNTVRTMKFGLLGSQGSYDISPNQVKQVISSFKAQCALEHKPITTSYRAKYCGPVQPLAEIEF